jgi:hypothetical protein
MVKEERTVPKLDLDRIIAACESGDNVGFCIACHAETYGVEPDMRRGVCESCGEKKVFGAQELIIRMG